MSYDDNEWFGGYVSLEPQVWPDHKDPAYLVKKAKWEADLEAWRAAEPIGHHRKDGSWKPASAEAHDKWWERRPKAPKAPMPKNAERFSLYVSEEYDRLGLYGTPEELAKQVDELIAHLKQAVERAKKRGQE